VQGLREIYGAAWAAHEADGIAKLNTEDTHFQTHIGLPPVVGRDAMRTACAQIFEQYENFRPETRHALYGARHWVLEWTLHATTAGKDFSVDCIDVVVLSDEGLVASKDTYMDAAQLQSALG
jgi:ketosteroid isomerase-like protein